MPKQILFNEEARRALKRGVDTVADAVKTTLGPRGRNVAIDKKFGAPTVTHDGVTVAQEGELKDALENMGSRPLARVATKTNEVAGKGTTFEKEYTDGMQIDRGYISAYFVTNAERMEAELEEPYILITDKKISGLSEILPVLEKALQVTKNFVIIAEDIDGEALATLV